MGKKLIERIAQATTTETKKLLCCNACKHTFDVTNMTPETITERGWTLYKVDKKYNAILICGGCHSKFNANS